MRFNKTINIYILKELIGPFFLGLLIFTFVLLMEQVLRLIEMVINKGVNLSTVLKLVMYLMPSFLVLTIPMAVLVATLSAFGRLSTDSEITALKASGISLYTLLVPVMIFATTAGCLTFFFYAKAMPWGNHQFLVTMYELARTKASVGLKKHVFNATFPQLVIYVNDIDADESFKGVMISDSRDNNNPLTIFARKGQLISDEKALRVILRLYDGVSHPRTLASSSRYQISQFPILDILLSFQAGNLNTDTDLPRTDRDMTNMQLIREFVILRGQETQADVFTQFQYSNTGDSWLMSRGISGLWLIGKTLVWESFFTMHSNVISYLVELHKRFSIPIACLVFGLIATPLGIQSQRAGKSGGFAISVMLILVYYIFITAGENMGDNGQLPVVLAVWTPNALLGIVGLLLLIRTARR